jgi:hypothetical protein
MHPPDVVPFLDLERLILLRLDDPTVQDKDDVIFARLFNNGFDHGLVLFGLTDKSNHLNELGPLLELPFLTVDGRFQSRPPRNKSSRRTGYVYWGGKSGPVATLNCYQSTKSCRPSFLSFAMVGLPSSFQPRSL